MGIVDFREMVVIGNIVPEYRKRKARTNVFSAAEVDDLDPAMLSGKEREELSALQQKLFDTAEELDPGDCDPGDPGWELWEKRMDRLDLMMDAIDEMLFEEEPEDEDEDPFT